jgi:mono/diheme cytochrome c family protein
MRVRSIHASIVASALALLLGGCSILKGLEVGFPAAAKLRHGEVVAQRSCSACHAIGGAGARGQGRALSFAAISKKYSPAGLELEMRAIADAGHYSMPAIPLSPKDQAGLAAYIASLRGAPDR